MKILHLAYSDTLDGACQAAYRIHSGLVSAGIDSRMLVVRKKRNDNTIVGPITVFQKIKSKCYPYLASLISKILKRKKFDIYSYNCFGCISYSDIKRIDFDILHLHWIGCETIRIEELGKIDKPVVWRLPDMWPFSGSEHYTFDNIRQKEGYKKSNRKNDSNALDIDSWVWERKKKAYNKSKNLIVVTPSRWLAQCAKESVLFSKRRVEVIPTGIDLDKFYPIEKDRARGLLKLQVEGLIILTGASTADHPRKGFNLLSQALKIINNDYKCIQKITLVLFGSKIETDLKSLQNLNVIQVGHIDNPFEMARLYAAADFFVVPSILENLANTVIESMACGTPVIAYNIGGMSDIIKHKKNGYLAETTTAESLVEGINWFLDNKHLYPNLKKCAYETVQKEFSNSTQVKKLIDLYNGILCQQRI
jgi:glycosyltransferase involved in cell wall biosynthesis